MVRLVILVSSKTETGIFEVQDTKKSGGAFVHQGIVTVGNLKTSQNVEAIVKADIREATARNHSATHLLHAALRQILGSHVQQKALWLQVISYVLTLQMTNLCHLNNYNKLNVS